MRRVQVRRHGTVGKQGGGVEKIRRVQIRRHGAAGKQGGGVEKMRRVQVRRHGTDLRFCKLFYFIFPTRFGCIQQPSSGELQITTTIQRFIFSCA